MRSLVASAWFSFLLVACVSDSPTTTPGVDGGADVGSVPDAVADTGGSCNTPKTSCTKGSVTVCTDTASDDQNCGQCNDVCPADATCKSSKCSCSVATKTFCAVAASGVCVDLKTDSKNCGACGNACFTDHCTNGECDHVAFVTSDKQITQLIQSGDPFPAADKYCATAATAAKLPGKYMAWISTDFNEPANRFTTKGTTPYVRTDKTVLATSWGDLIDGSLSVPLNRDENGVALGASERVMTDTSPAGARDGASLHCNNWTDPSGSGGYYVGQGDPSATNASWTSMGATGACGSQYHLYCFQQ